MTMAEPASRENPVRPDIPGGEEPTPAEEMALVERAIEEAA